jgi:hypothetical protein
VSCNNRYGLPNPARWIWRSNLTTVTRFPSHVAHALACTLNSRALHVRDGIRPQVARSLARS